MGRVMFTAIIATEDDLKEVVRVFIKHNREDMVNSGTEYSYEEFKTLDPLRASLSSPEFLAEVCDAAKASLVSSCHHRWNRGEDFSQNMYGVMHEGNLYFTMQNGGGGACSTLWLERESTLKWHGTRGKPDGWIESPAVFFADSLTEAIKLAREHINPPPQPLAGGTVVAAF
jgi:hypothetical protein